MKMSIDICEKTVNRDRKLIFFKRVCTTAQNHKNNRQQTTKFRKTHQTTPKNVARGSSKMRKEYS